MKSIIPPFNPELMEILNDFINDLMENDLSKLNIHNVNNAKRIWGELPDDQPGDYYTSPEHLEHMQNKKYIGELKRENGFAEATYGSNMSHADARAPKEIADIISKVNNDLLAFFGSKFNAVSMYYPQGGFMGWHNNGNASGYNILLSWTNGEHKGYFQFIDPITKELVVLNDDENMLNGWTIKVGYFGPLEKEDELVWHSARTFDNERITLAYVIPDEYKYMWDMMVEDLKA
jgi:hypothetical protein